MERFVNRFLISFCLCFIYKCLEYLGCSQYKIGNLSEGTISLSKLASSIFDSDPFEDYKCINCKYFPICGGGCPLDRLKMREDPGYSSCTCYKDNIDNILEYLNYDNK